MIESPKVGDRVSYADAANPRKVGIVAEGPRADQYRVVWYDDGLDSPETWSDLRQAGWKRVDRPALGTALRRVERFVETERFSPSFREALEVVLDAARKGAR